MNPSAQTQPKPLTGLRIIDLTMAWAGPMATRVCAYLGADVIHVEAPNRHDSWRGPLNGGDPRRYPKRIFGERPYDRNCMFNTQNQGKRAICVDIKQPAGLTLIKRLARHADALVANFTPGALQRLGLDDAALREANPRLVVLEMPAFGSFGPMASNVALGPTMEAASGMAHFVGYGDGRPYVTGPAYLDPIGAFNGAAALLTALNARRRGCDVTHVELAQCEAAMHWIGELLLAGGDGEEPTPEGNAVDYAEPHGAYPCAGDDRWVAIAVRDDAHWRGLCAVMSDAPFTADTDFVDLLVRHRRRAELRQAISAWTRGRTAENIARALQAHGVPAAPVCDGPAMARRPDLWTAGFFEQLEHPAAGTHWYQGLPLRYGDELLHAERPAPVFGEHTRQVLRELADVTDDEYAQLVADQVVSAEPLNRPAPRAAEPAPSRDLDSQSALADPKE